MKNVFAYLVLKERGASLALIAIALIAIVGIVGISLDHSRLYHLQNRAQSALDSAALAAAKLNRVDGQSDDEYRAMIIQKAEEYFSANLYYEGFTPTRKNFIAHVASDFKSLALSARYSIPSSFSKVLGFRELEVFVSNEAKKDIKSLELALVLDVTGSMKNALPDEIHTNPDEQPSRMRVLKSAAKELIETVLPQDETLDPLSRNVSIVPYAGAVNIGTQHDQFMKGAWPGASVGGINDPWRGCVMADNGARRVNDDPPNGSDKSDYYYWVPEIDTYGGPGRQDNFFNDWNTGTSGPYYGRQGGLGEGAHFGPNVGCPLNSDGTSATTPTVLGKQSDWDPTLFPPIVPVSVENSILPLVDGSTTEGRDKLLQKIEKIWYRERVGTLHSSGLLWGWRTISQRWRAPQGETFWEYADSQPIPEELPRDIAQTKKAIVLMSDGNTEIRINSDQCKSYGSDFSPWGYLIPASNPCSNINDSAYRDAVALRDEETQVVCDNIRAQEIEIYTVALAVGTSQLLRDCACGRNQTCDNYFEANTANGLITAFQEIARRLKTSLRLSK